MVDFWLLKPPSALPTFAWEFCDLGLLCVMNELLTAEAFCVVNFYDKLPWLDIETIARFWWVVLDGGRFY